MLPKTLEEAKKYRYGAWAGKPEGTGYEAGYCAYECMESGRGMLFYQCTRKNGHGPEALYCKQHAKMLEKQYI